jgi:hypothetical protein
MMGMGRQETLILALFVQNFYFLYPSLNYMYKSPKPNSEFLEQDIYICNTNINYHTSLDVP